MRVSFVTVIALVSPLLLSAHGVRADPVAAAPTPAGLWQAVDSGTKQPTGWFLITDHDGVYDGIIAKMFLKPGEDPNVVCDQCKDDRHDQRWLGLEIIRGMKQEEPDKYGGGILPAGADGQTARAAAVRDAVAAGYWRCGAVICEWCAGGCLSGAMLGLTAGFGLTDGSSML